MAITTKRISTCKDTWNSKITETISQTIANSGTKKKKKKKKKKKILVAGPHMEVTGIGDD